MIVCWQMQVNLKGQKKTDPCAVSLINLLVWYKCKKVSEFFQILMYDL